MSKENRRWLEALVVAVVGVAALCCGCVDLAPCASYLDEHLERVAEDVTEIARLTPVDAEARPLVEAVYWRTTTRIQPWAKEFRRAQGPIVVNVPGSPADNRAMVRENRALEKLTSDIDFMETVLPKGLGKNPLSGVLGLLGGAAPGGIMSTLLLLWGRAKKKKLVSTDLVRMKLHNALDRVKTAAPDAVTAATEQDPLLKESYERYKAEKIAEELRTKDDLRRRGSGIPL